jgi:RimJ/RimL family protein N-acetyltransferase
VRLLIGWAQSQPGVRVITARVDHGNVASERLLNRLGFAYTDEDNGMQRFALPTA